jgi:hypothetical protein
VNRVPARSAPPPSSFGHLASALPDALTALAYLVTWCNPLGFGTGTVKALMLVMLMEFVLVHASGFFFAVALGGRGSRMARSLVLLGLGLFYLGFVAAFAFAFDAYWPYAAFAWLLLSRLAWIWGSPRSRERERERQQLAWVASVVLYIIGAFVTVLPIIPRLGLSTEVVPQLGLTGSGHWIEHPESVIAFGMLYFGAQAWLKFDPGLTLLATRFQRRRPPA